MYPSLNFMKAMIAEIITISSMIKFYSFKCKYDNLGNETRPTARNLVHLSISFPRKISVFQINAGQILSAVRIKSLVTMTKEKMPVQRPAKLMRGYLSQDKYKFNVKRYLMRMQGLASALPCLMPQLTTESIPWPLVGYDIRK